MGNSKNVSFRNETVGSIADLLVDEGLVCADSQNILAYLADQLVEYREEGRLLTPDIIYCKKMGASLQGLPGLVYHKLGTERLKAEAGKKILKDCAPLSGPRWFIVIQRLNPRTVEYGVASYADLPTSQSLLDSILLNKQAFTILARKTGNKSVTFWGSKGNKANFLFSTLREIGADREAISAFALSLITSKLANVSEDRALVEEFGIFLDRTLYELVTTCHGCILASTKIPSVSGIDELSDCVILSKPIDLYDIYTAYRINASAETLTNVQATIDLMRGFINSDGIVLFTTSGELFGFRAFHKNKSDAPLRRSIEGGARRRAFEGAKSLIPRSMSAILFRSQDGLTLYHGARHV